MPAENRVLERAEMYLRKLACGINPLTDEGLSETDICKQERISKCLSYVADYLRQNIFPEGNAPVQRPVPKKTRVRESRGVVNCELVLNSQDLEKFEISTEPVSISGLIRRLNSFIPKSSGMISLLYADVVEFLSQAGIVSKQNGEAEKESNLPTPYGESLGFVRTEADIHGRHAIFTGCSVEAQKFILDNVQKCVENANARLAKRKSSTKDKVRHASNDSKSPKFHLSEEQFQRYPSDEIPVPVSEIARRLNELLSPGVQRIYYKPIRDWFVAQGMLEEVKNVVGKISFLPTEKGKTAGLLTEPRMGKNGEEYEAVLYGRQAQQLVLAHVNEIA